MPSFLVTYDLAGPERDYDELIAHLKGDGTYSHVLKSTWLIVSELTSTQIQRRNHPRDHRMKAQPGLGDERSDERPRRTRRADRGRNAATRPQIASPLAWRRSEADFRCEQVTTAATHVVSHEVRGGTSLDSE